jgi:hypothetical protein
MNIHVWHSQKSFICLNIQNIEYIQIYLVHIKYNMKFMRFLYKPMKAWISYKYFTIHYFKLLDIVSTCMVKQD